MVLASGTMQPVGLGGIRDSWTLQPVSLGGVGQLDNATSQLWWDWTAGQCNQSAFMFMRLGSWTMQPVSLGEAGQLDNATSKPL